MPQTPSEQATSAGEAPATNETWHSPESREEWRNSCYLALRHLIRLKPAKIFQEACADCEHFGGRLAPRQSVEFYDDILRLGDASEQKLLTSEVGNAAFNVVVLAGDTESNYCGLRVYFAVKDAAGKFRIGKRLLDMRLLGRNIRASMGRLPMLLQMPTRRCPPSALGWLMALRSTACGHTKQRAVLMFGHVWCGAARPGVCVSGAQTINFKCA